MKSREEKSKIPIHANPGSVYKEHWLQVSKDLDLRMKSRDKKSKIPIHAKADGVHANPGINNGTSNPQPQTKLPNSDEHTSPGQLDTASPFSSNKMDAPQEQESERNGSIEAKIFEVIEKLEKHKREQEKQGQLGAVKLDESDEAVKATAKQLEAATSKDADEAVKVKAEAKKLAADAMARHKKQQERKEYVQGRAQDIHENLLQFKPFDIDAVRREFSEKEVQDIKKLVRELELEKN